MQPDVDTAAPQRLTQDEFDALLQRVKGTGGWDESDRRGALNHLTPAHRIAAAAEVRLGRSVTLSRPIETERTADNPEPAHHDMTGADRDHHLDHGVDFALDRFSMNIH